MVDVSPRAVLDRDRDRDAIRAALAAHGVERAGVFGSVARGEDTTESDLDLIVAFRPGVRRDLVGIADDLTRLTGLNVDVVDRDRVLERARRTGVGYRILRDTVPL
ncbi:MAG: nucleotidyltransferase domain-containing protein [Microbacteriaceae bacterium]|nr:nucleotidyltransferase domain-containing protein [Microbacteriaceae bacterium]